MIAPAKFPGTTQQAQDNINTHIFDHEASRCMTCDCRPWGRVAQWPCEFEVPMVKVG